MEIKEKVVTLIQGSILYQEYSGDIDDLVSKIDETVGKFLQENDKYTESQSKDNYKYLADAIAEMHYAYRVGQLILSEELEVDTEPLQVLIDEIEALFSADATALSFSEEDRDYIVAGQLIKMSLYYTGDPNDVNADPQPVDGFSSVNRVFSLNAKSSKLRKHLLNGRTWNLMK